MTVTHGRMAITVWSSVSLEAWESGIFVHCAFHSSLRFTQGLSDSVLFHTISECGEVEMYK